MIFMREGANPVWKQSVLLAASLALIAQVGVEAASKTVKKGTSAKSADALTLYNQRNFLAASQAFYKKVSANPEDADSYYYMGNCAVALKNFPQALQYYKRATDISPDSPTGLASKQAIDRVNELMNPKPAAANAAPGKAKILSDKEDGSEDKSNKDKDKKDPRLVAAEAQGDAKIAAADKAAKKILDDATTQCKPIKDEEDGAVNDSVNPRLAGTEQGNQIANEVRSPYEERIKNIMEPAKKKAQALKDAAKKEADAIKAAVSLSKK